MHIVDFCKYADIIKLLQMKNENYWVVKLFDDKLMIHIRNNFTQDSGKALFTKYQSLCDETVNLKIEGEAPESDNGQEIAKEWCDNGAVNNFISAFIHLFIMSLVIFFVAPLTFSAKIPANIVLYFVSLAVFIIACLGVSIIFGLLIKSISKFTMASQFIFLPSIMLSGIMFPVDMLPKVFENIGKIFPATWGFKMMTSEVFDISLLLPRALILAVTLCISGYRLSKMGIE